MLGFAIEETHQQTSIEFYDLLAGSGKNSFYKQQFKGIEQNFISFKIPFDPFTFFQNNRHIE